MANNIELCCIQFFFINAYERIYPYSYFFSCASLLAVLFVEKLRKKLELGNMRQKRSKITQVLIGVGFCVRTQTDCVYCLLLLLVLEHHILYISTYGAVRYIVAVAVAVCMHKAVQILWKEKTKMSTFIQCQDLNRLDLLPRQTTPVRRELIK